MNAAALERSSSASARQAAADLKCLVRITDLQKIYRTRDGDEIHALKDVNLAIRERARFGRAA